VSISVNHAKAEEKLREAWKQTENESVRPPQAICELVKKVMEAPDITYKYVLVTGFLAKCTEGQVHPRALQAGSSLSEAYDARSLCHSIVVGFEKEQGNLFGLSNEPFLNKPARHPEHDKNNPQLRNKRLAAVVHDLLEWANQASSSNVFAGLVHILRLGKLRAADQKQAALAVEVNLERTVTFINQFLRQTDGGARLSAVWGAFTDLLHEAAEVSVGSPTEANSFSGAAGDVQVFLDKQLVSAAECKHRPLTADDLEHGVKKAVQRGASQYLFVCAAGIAEGQREAVTQALNRAAQILDVAVIDVFQDAPALARMLGPDRRATFGQKVVELLHKMRRPEAANEAAELWNRLED